MKWHVITCNNMGVCILQYGIKWKNTFYKNLYDKKIHVDHSKSVPLRGRMRMGNEDESKKF